MSTPMSAECAHTNIQVLKSYNRDKSVRQIGWACIDCDTMFYPAQFVAAEVKAAEQKAAAQGYRKAANDVTEFAQSATIRDGSEFNRGLQNGYVDVELYLHAKANEMDEKATSLKDKD